MPWKLECRATWPYNINCSVSLLAFTVSASDFDMSTHSSSPTLRRSLPAADHTELSKSIETDRLMLSFGSPWSVLFSSCDVWKVFNGYAALLKKKKKWNQLRKRFCILTPGCRIKPNWQACHSTQVWLLFLPCILGEELFLNSQVPRRQFDKLQEAPVARFVLETIPRMLYWRSDFIGWQNVIIYSFPVNTLQKTITARSQAHASLYILIHAYRHWTQLCNFKCGVHEFKYRLQDKNVIYASLHEMIFC